jgi:hypothetical protein
LYPAEVFLLCVEAAHGAPSYCHSIQLLLLLVAEAPRGVCSRAFVEGGTHNANFDGVCFYPKLSLPGYAALFK